MSTTKRDTGQPAAKRGEASADAKRGEDEKGGPPRVPDAGVRHETASAAVGHPSAPRRGLLRAVLVALVVGGAAGGGVLLVPHNSSGRESSFSGAARQRRRAAGKSGVQGRWPHRFSWPSTRGTQVTAGQVIATLDKHYFDDDLRVARARRDNAAAALARLEHGSRPEEIARARRKWPSSWPRSPCASKTSTVRTPGGQGAVSREDVRPDANPALIEAEARLKSAEENEQMIDIGPRQEDIEAARANWRPKRRPSIQSERRLTDSELIAPSDGVILTRAREQGAIVAPGETVFTLTLASPVWVRTYVNERDLGRIRPGMAGQVRTDSAPDKLPGADRLHLAHGRVHAQDGRDARSCAPTWSTGCASSSTTPTAACGRACRSPVDVRS